MFAWQATVQDEQGNAVVLPVATVYLEDGETLASIFNEDGVALPNPLTGTLEGFIQFWADVGVYKVVGADGGDETEVWSITLADTEQYNDPKKFGAVGDGVTDDTAALQRWADAGGFLMGDGRTYRVTGSILFRKDAHVSMNGMRVIHDTTAITPIFDVYGLDYFICDGGWFNGRKDLKPAVQSQGHGIRIVACENFSITGNRFDSIHEHSVSVYSQEPSSVPITGPTIKSKKGIISHNHFINGGNRQTGRGYAVWMFGNVEKFVVSNNMITDDCMFGICIDDASSGGPARISRDCVISDNIAFVTTNAYRFESSSIGTITGNIGVVENDGTFPNGTVVAACMVRSIQQSVDATHKVTVSGNYFQGPQYAFLADNVENLIVSDNILVQSDAFNVAYTLTGACWLTRGDNQPSRGVIVSNNDVSSTTNGIYITRADTTLNEDILVQGNTVRYTGSAPATSSNVGISAALTNDLTIKDNDVSGFYRNIRASSAGIANGRLMVVDDNTTTDSVDSNMVIEGTQPKRIRGNTQRRAGNGNAIVFFSGANGANTEVSMNDAGGHSVNFGDVDVLVPNIGGKQGPEATAAQISSATATINTINKVAGREVRDTTNNRKMMATGSTATSTWVRMDGSNPVTPA